MGPVQTFADFLDMVRRRAGLILLIAGLGCVVAVLVALDRKHLYRATEVIQVVQPKVAGDLARSTIEGSAAQRLQSIEQRVMARDSVLEVVEIFGLFDDVPGMTVTEKVDALRDAATIEFTAAAGNGRVGAVSILTVSAEMSTPQEATQIAHEFARRTIALSRETRLEKARETLAFFAAREETLRQQVERIEDQMAAFRRANNMTPLGSLSLLQNEVADINLELLSIGRERIRIERGSEQARQSQRKATADRILADTNAQLATLDAQVRLLEERKAELENAIMTSIKTSPQIDRQISDFESQLEQLRSELEVASARRTEAEVGYRLETQGQGEQLTVIEPAMAPDYPFTPSRAKMAMAGAFVSLVVALGVALALEVLNPVMRTAAHMERDLGIKPVVSVPRLNTRRYRRGLLARIFRRPARRRTGDTALF